MSAVVLVAATIGGLATEGREKAHLRAVFSQYVSRTVVDRILADPARAKLGGERKELTVLFSDIRGFSAFAEGMGPEALASFLGEYLTPMTELVLESGGTLDKYIGDAVMAIWAAPIDMPDHAARACEVALRMQEALVELNKQWTGRGQARDRDRHRHQHRPMSVGNMGTHGALRLHRARRSGEPRRATRGADEGVRRRHPRRRGDREGGRARRSCSARSMSCASRAAPARRRCTSSSGARARRVDDRFADALAAYRRRDFARGARRSSPRSPTTRPPQLMAKRCAELAAAPPPDDWDGVYEQRSK